MARVGGRNEVIAWIIGLLSVAVVLALLVLALPALPFGSGFVSQLLGQSRPTTSPTVDATEAALPTTGCGPYLGDALWQSVALRRGVQLVEAKDAPTSAAKDLVGALSPQVQLSCAFTGPGGTEKIVTSISTVTVGAEQVATAALGSTGFQCVPFGQGTRCTRTIGAVTEDDVIEGQTWLSTTFTNWRPLGYTEAFAAKIWPK